MAWKRSHTYLLAVYAAIVVISLLHYSTGMHAHHLHDIYRRLYYFPIILAAFLHGLRGGLIAAIVVCLAYLPHATGHISEDPASSTQKMLEMLLYVSVGLITGYLVSNLKRTQLQLESSMKQHRQTEDELLMSAKLAAVGRLSAGLAHEIRNPLASIKGSAEILADDFPADHRKHRMLRVLVDESDRLNNVLARFLAFARPRPLEWAEISIRSEIEDVIALLQNQREGQSVRPHISPSSGDDALIQGDREQLRQVILNVLLNAYQAAGEDGDVWIETESRSETFVLRVRDSGPGFNAEALEHAFTPFFTTKDEGSGLGLAVSHRIVELHSGQVRILNSPEGGGVVELEIPLRGAHG